MKIYECFSNGEPKQAMLLDWDAQKFIIPAFDGYIYPYPWSWSAGWSGRYFSEELWDWLPEW